MMNVHKIHKERALIFLIDILFSAFSFLFAILLRFDFGIHPQYQPYLWQGIAVVTLARMVAFYWAGLYRSVLRYAGINEVMQIVKGATVGSGVYVALLFFPEWWFPRTVLIMDWILIVGLLSVSHFAVRFFRDYFMKLTRKGKRILIYGAGDAGDMAVREIQKSSFLEYNVIGFIDDDPAKHNSTINGIPVFGGKDSLIRIVEKENIEEILVAVPSASGKLIRDITFLVKDLKIHVSTVPTLHEILSGKVSISSIRRVRLEDLIRREPVKIDNHAISGYLNDKIVLVTGAAGSIGSELSAQIAGFNPKNLLLVDRNENGMFHLRTRLSENGGTAPISYFIRDIGHEDAMKMLFEEHKPDVVFHTAAYKHVPFMEENPGEAVINNIFNTKLLTEIAGKFHVERFVQISTDKAVNPSSVMGATKRLIELHIQKMAEKSATRFLTVRFGNVIGSEGSVVPLFRKQIAAGGPVTVTDKNMVRFFMTIPEAVSLICQACILGVGGEIFILDMGEPLRIVNMAEDLIRLSGMEPYRDIDIQFIGTRGGEKLYEELWFPEERPERTAHSKILKAQPAAAPPDNLDRQLKTLIALARKKKEMEIKSMLAQILPTYNGAGE